MPPMPPSVREREREREREYEREYERLAAELEAKKHEYLRACKWHLH